MEKLQDPGVPGYAVGRLLGHGGSSSVWLVMEERTGREFALKCLRRPARRAARGEAMTEEGIRREIRILSVLDHPHLIKAHSAVRVEDGPDSTAGLIMDYAPAGSLGGLVAARGRLSVGETVTVLTPIAQVLGYLHSKGFTHADVSPGNVLFTGQGKPMLSDVGIARMLGDPASAPGRGTPGFMDPAPVDAVRAGLQPERDVYSAAALGWFCLTGAPPQRTADRPPLTLLVPEVPRELAAALESGLTEDRRLRPTAAALGTAIYRSASPLPLDLASAVHPTVLPKLVTRLHAQASPSRLREKLGGLRRRLATSTWAGWFPAPQKLPFPASNSTVSTTVQAPPSQASGAQRKDQIARDQGIGKPALDKRKGKPTRNQRNNQAALNPGKSRPARVRGRARHAQAERRGPLRRGAVAAAAVSAAVCAWWLVGAGLTAAGPDSPPAGQSAGTAGAYPETPPVEASQRQDPADAARLQAGSLDPGVAVQGLSSLRSLAFSSGRLELLDEVNQPGSGAAAADRRIAERLRASGHTLAGFSTALSQVQAEEGATSASAVMAVTSASSAYEEKDAQGAVVAVGAAGAEQRLRVVLVSVDGKWRVSEILPGP
ncbi:serine/threonine protein kinase [Pseudarthrobacter sp. W1I19]|uniref:serine/threonine-protein kinase n=1 Tax=Pseudarthrobacter sp. W1I19 TaxID=3042288 RepID=UPI00278B2226|nr:serine/threonine-protein kinase [Pseudarthrobacter sp. W1I19]MDQ0923998.1 serine/threonine protein kinase [Pseudarthrobacter sp. W1I19]